MGAFNLRSLLAAAIFISSCIQWTTSRHHYTHNAITGHRIRHRRQGAGLFLSGSYVIPDGEGGGPWGEWKDESACSRTCGGGVASQKRICLEVGPDNQPTCTGGDTKYFSCNTQDCPPGSGDFRSEQCASYNGVAIRNLRAYDNWVPYTNGPNPCELNCMPRGERFYYRHKAKVTDGTRCNDESPDVCVDGKCQPVGCDMMLGSLAREDKCRECRGNGTNCNTIDGLIDEDFKKGYNDILLIPEGATSIVIREIRPSSNYLALRSQTTGTYYLNGDYHVDFPRSLTIAGALWHYERSSRGFDSPDKLRSLGPTIEPLYLSLLLMDENVGIQYEYSLPTSIAPPSDQQYNWVHEEFSPCSASCGGGIQIRNVTCRSREALELVDDSLCNVHLRPATNTTCNTQSCAARWVEGPWSPCSKNCGDGGVQSREVYCEKIITNGETFRFPSKVADKDCFDILGPKPELYQKCNQNATCPIWFTGPWKPCNKLCGEGKQTRLVVCHQKNDGRVTLLPDGDCADEKPEEEKPCQLHPCEGVDWVLSDWVGCDTCLSRIRTRVAECATKNRKVVNESACAYHPKPVLEEECDATKLPPCQAQWYATQWSNCSVECGKGLQMRRVFCGVFDGGSIMKVEDSRCDSEEKYKDTRPCEVPEEKCPAKWFAGPWTECTKECGGGEQYRRTMCLSGGKEVSTCNPDTVLDTTQSCNINPCNVDELMPLDSKTTPIMDDDEDYEDCEEESEDYEEAAAEADDDLGAILPTTKSLSTLEDELMFSDSPSTTDEEGSGLTTFSELESEFTADTGSGSESTISTEEGSGFTTSDETSITTESSSDGSSTSEGSTVSGSSTETSASDSSSDVSVTEATAASETYDTESTATEFATAEYERDTPDPDSITDYITEEASSTPKMSESDGTTESDSTVTGSEGSTLSTETEETGSTESTVTDITETGSTETTESSSTDETTETSLSSSTDSETGSTDTSTDITGTTETTESGATETTESAITESSTDISTTELSTSGSETTETGDTETTETGSTESSGTTESGPTETTETTESGPTETTETTEFGATDTSGTTESGPTETTETTESGATETTETTETGSTETTELGETESSTTESTDTTESSTTEITGETETTESTVTEETATTETEETVSTESTSEISSTEYSSTDGSTDTEETTPWDLASTVEVYTKKPRCKPRKKAAKCRKSKFGCCADKKTPAAGPFEEGCPVPKTCKETLFGCCPDGVSPALGKNNKGCPIEPCNETLYGCCESDHLTPAEGNDQEGCPPPPPACLSSKFGCCADGETAATGLKKKGCPETITTTEAAPETEKPEEKPEESCEDSEFGCCYDNSTAATGPEQQGCPCNATQFGCCPDGVEPAQGTQMEGCVLSCNTSAHGCCHDGETPAHGPDQEGCCLLTAYGCCPDNYKAAEGPHLEGCGCEYSRFGCCPDNTTVAHGSNLEGCGCQYTAHGCCPDKHTPASGPEFEGCSCHTYQFGCCPDGNTIAQGPNLQGCQCQRSKYGCCGDEQTAATGPDMEGCDCSTSKYGCCPDGSTEATGPKFLGCTDIPVNKQAACNLPSDYGPCNNNSVQWFYNATYGGCSRFWYGGCEGNDNRFSSKESCEKVCVDPPAKDACKLPKVKGICEQYLLRWYYDSERETCGQFVYGGCIGNSNNFETRELCQDQCEPERSDNQCDLPIESGQCAGTFRRWGYSSELGRCEEFLWGGCGGNNNRFSSEAACILRCNPPGALKPACTLPQEPGNCTDKYATWSFNQPENRCQPFYYTGCGGNGNRFQSEQSCMDTCPSTYQQELCTLPAETGDCADYREKWYYNTASKRCMQFYYGGCGGNGNNFGSREECEARCSEAVITTTTQPSPPEPFRDEFCFLEKEPGPCSNWEPRWAYDAARGECTQFQYGGCRGNRNNFPSQEYCEYRCKETQDVCQLPMRTGPCRASIMSWFYDPTTDSCSQFTYGGCDGNGNRFETLEACERQCRTGPGATAATAPPAQSSPQCVTSPALEDCTGPEGDVWLLNERGECVAHYNPNGGPYCRNTGVFPTQETCERTCGSFRGLEVCRFPLDPGPCRSSLRKYFYNASSSSCEPFAYGGCLGGPNRFSTEEECQTICQPRQASDPCEQPVEPGNCVESNPMWYYESSSDECREFLYGGCEGNDNRFGTRQECEGRCKKRLATTTTLRPYYPPPQVVGEECRTPASLEACGENITMFYYDAERRQCLSADIGACRLPNSYRSAEECERHCGSFQHISNTDLCNTAVSAGAASCPEPGARPATKLYWDAASRSCQQFTYSGCGGGPNMFSSYDECEEICAPLQTDATCELPLETGAACAGAERQQRWYYNDYYRNCLEFVYEGCGGNANNFQTFDQCASTCRPTELPEPVAPPRDCSQHEAECSALRCEYGVQRTRTRDGCERCSCVQVEVSCGSLTEECDNLKCTYGQERTRDSNGCDRCKCLEHPCAGTTCGAGERCVAISYRDPITAEPRYSSECRIVNKDGMCPLEFPGGTECRRQCNDDADCPGVGKCCSRDCRQLCLEPAAATSPSPLTTHSTPYAPEVPQPPSVPDNPETDVAVQEGGKATLRCLFHGNPVPFITWKRGEILIDGQEGRYRVLSDGALEIVSLYRNDSGIYICIGTNELGSAQQEIRLTVGDPVEQTPAGIAGESEATVTGELGRELHIRCLAYGHPSPIIAWYRGLTGPMVPYSSNLYEARGNILTIRTLAVESLGEYSCQAYNGVGKPASWTVVVQAYRTSDWYNSPYLIAREPPLYGTPPAPPTAAVTAPTYTVAVSARLVAAATELTAGNELDLACDVTGSPQPEITWTKDGAPISPIVGRIEISDARLTIHAVSASDSGEYGCLARNQYDTNGDSVRVTVQGPTEPRPDGPTYIVAVSVRLSPAQTTLAAGGTLDLPCEVDGYPEPDVTWTKDNLPIQPDSRTFVTGARLTIYSVTASDSGEYGCHARNQYESRSTAVRVAVQGLTPAWCTDNPFFANCKLIVRSKFCRHDYYSRFCCKSCVEAGQLDPSKLQQPQADEPFKRR